MKQVSLNSVVSSYPVPGTVTTVFVTSVTVYTNYYSVLIMYNNV